MSRDFKVTMMVLAGVFLLICVIVPHIPDYDAGIAAQANSSSSTSTEVRSCTPADFSLSKLKANDEYDEAKLTGIVTSHCASAYGVQLKWTAFNSDGTVAFSNNFWPASTTNIPPHSDYAFEMMNSAPRGKWTYRVEPIKVNVW